MPAETITRFVTEKVKEAKPGTMFFPADLLEFGAPDAIHQTFSRLARNKTLLRLAKGIYAKPTMDPELGALRPSLENVAQQIAERDKVVIRPTGAAALNKLGLSTQVPTKVVYLTNGNPKRIQVGRSTIVFKKTTHKQLAVQPETVFLAIQALNLVRIISLFYLGQWNRVWFDWFHLYLWQALIVLDALVAFLIWLRYLPRQSGPATAIA